MKMKVRLLIKHLQDDFVKFQVIKRKKKKKNKMLGNLWVDRKGVQWSPKAPFHKKSHERVPWKLLKLIERKRASG